MPESSCFRTPFPSQSVHRSQKLLKSERQHFYPNSPLIQHILSYKRSLLVRSEILGLFGNTLAPDHMYSRRNSEKFPQQVKTPLSEKRKTVPAICIAFLQSTRNFVHFGTGDELHRLNIWEVIDSEKCGDLNAPKLLFQNTILESKCSGVPNTAEIRTAALLS